MRLHHHRLLIRLNVLMLLSIASMSSMASAQTISQEDINKAMATRQGGLIQASPEQQEINRNNAKIIIALMEEVRQDISDHNLSEAISNLEKRKAVSGQGFCYALYGDLLFAVGRTEEALTAYRTELYPNNPDRDGKPIMDWSAQIGKRFESMTAEERKKISRGNSSRNNARYALLLCKAGHIEEAIQVYEWAREGMLLAEDGEDIYGKGWYDAMNLRMTPETFDARRFNAACYTLISLDHNNGLGPWYDAQTGTLFEDIPTTERKHYNDYDKLAVLAAQRAVATQPRFAPAYLVLGRTYDMLALSDRTANAEKQESYRQLAKQSYQKAGEFARSQAVREIVHAKLQK